MDLKLNDKIAIVTGSSKGLGFASAKALVGEGCRVTICARNAAQLSEAETELKADAGRAGAVLTVQADVAKPDGIASVVARTVQEFGGGGITAATDDDWRAAFDRTLYPAIRASRAAVPYLRRSEAGVIIMIASIWGRESGGLMTYNAVKAAEISLGKSMAQQLAPEGIRVVTVAPGSILFSGGSWHRRQQEDPEGIAKFVESELPFGRFGRAEEVGAVVAFLCSPRASWVSGACIPVDGCQSRSLI